jgi:hypothetical protein
MLASASSPNSVENSTRLVVFQARGLCKVYMMGEIQVHALRDLDLDIYEGLPARSRQFYRSVFGVGFLRALVRVSWLI